MFLMKGGKALFPNKNVHYQHPYMGYPQAPQRRKLFGRRQQMGTFNGQYPNPSQYYQHPQRQPIFPQQQAASQMYQNQPKQSIFHNEQGQFDFKKIGNGVQTAMGLANQVSPMMKMIGGFFSK